ncbi:MAG: YraN family protein [Bacteroidota bacterium]|nr:YraN family protein [Bacteroidota bacterium]
MADHNLLGKEGENLAVEYLMLKEYEILERNYRYQKAEVDIIAQRDQTLVAIEVKTRSTSNFGNPEEFVKPKQIKRLLKVMNHYAEENQLELDIRFDILAIVLNKGNSKIEHIQNAFLYF